MFDQISTQIAALLAVGAALLKVIRDIYITLKKNKLHQIDEVHKMDFEIYQAMRHILNETRADKVLILYVHNGGDVPQVGKPLYSSVSHEVINDNTKAVSGKWRNQPLDEFYTKMLVDLTHSPEHKVNLKTKEMPPCILKDVYESSGVDHSKVIHLYSYSPTKNKLISLKSDNTQAKTWYMSVVFYNHEAISSHERDVIRYSSNNIRQVLERQYKYS